MTKLFSLSGKTIVLTGASGFLGHTFCRALLEQGSKVIALGRSDKKLSDLSAQIQNDLPDSKLETISVDMYDIAELNKILNKIVKNEKKIDVLINNAQELNQNTGFNIPDGNIDNANFEQWMRNLTGGIYWAAICMQKISVTMKKQKKGSIINISSMYAKVAPSPKLYEGTSFVNPPGYSASKAGLVSLTRYAASFWGQYNIRCNAILPGPFSNTVNNSSNSVKKDDPFLKKLKSRTCLERIGKPEELIGPVIFLASDASSYVTGQELVVDGGWTII